MKLRIPAPNIDFDKSDAVIVIGLALLFAGFHQIYPPLAPIVCGAILLVFAWMGIKPRSPED